MEQKLLFSVTIKDCKVEAIASTKGGGGQNKNRRHTAVRITHPPSGAVGYSADERDQLRNKQLAWKRMCASDAFKKWHRLEVARLRSGKTVDEIVEELMDPVHLKVEVRTSEGWVPAPVEGEMRDE